MSSSGGRTPYERLLKQHCQKGVAASKSAGVVGRWGSTSFTSLRTAHGGPGGGGLPAPPRATPPAPKKFFKSRLDRHAQNPPNPSAPHRGPGLLESVTPVERSAGAPATGGAPVNRPVKRPAAGGGAPASVAPALSSLKSAGRLNKFFTSRPPKEPRVETWLTPPDPPAIPAPAPVVAKVPPLKLRIKPVLPPPPEPEVKPSLPDSPPPAHPSPEPEPAAPASPAVRLVLESESPPFSPAVLSSPSSASVPSPTPEEPEPVASTRSRISPIPPVVPLSNTASLARDWSEDEGSEPPPSPPRDPTPPPVPASAPVKRLSPVIPLTKAQTVAVCERVTPSEKESPAASPPPAPSGVPVDAPVARPRPVKKSIFKTKDRDQTSKKSLYKHNWHAHSDRPPADDFQREVLTRAVFGFPAPSASASGGGSRLDFDEDHHHHPHPSSTTAVAPTDLSFSASKLVRVASMPVGSGSTKSSSSSTSGGGRSHPLDDSTVQVMSVKCPKEQKEYYTVIKNVKRAHQIQDSGEFQEFNDDVDYILEGLGSRNNLSTRCLSTITLASKCMEPSFRMHLRAHGTVTKFFGELKDAPENSSLALCAATVLFVLSQDRLNMDLDRESLELMLNLLDTESRIRDALEGSGMNQRELTKNKQKVKDLVGAMKARGHAANLSLDHITSDHLAMETLLSLTSKRAGEWFKEELRELGGLDHLVHTLSDCVTYLTADEISMWTEPLHDKLKKAGRVLKVLENVTHENEENCSYLLKYEDCKFINLIHSMFRILDEEVPLNPSTDINDKDSVAFSLREVLFDVMRVYINLVHDYHQQCVGSEIAGLKKDMFDMTLHCLFSLPKSLPFEKRFDVLVLALTLLINLVENSKQNRALLMKSRVPNSSDTFLAESERELAPQGLIRLFLEKEESAKTEEAKTDNILDGVKEEDDDEEKEEERKKTQEERIDETVAKLLHKAGRHMEDTLIGSYVTLIIGYLIIDDKDHEATVRSFLPDGNFVIMVTVLKKFFNFMNLTASASVTSSRGIKATEAIIKHLEKIDRPKSDQDLDHRSGNHRTSFIKDDEEEEENFDDLTLFDVSKDDEDETLLNNTSTKYHNSSRIDRDTNDNDDSNAKNTSSDTEESLASFGKL